MDDRADDKTWDARYAEHGLVWGAEPNRFLREAADWFGLDRPGTVLDVAAGEGRNALWLAGHGWRATVVDFSEVALAKAGEQARGLGIADRVRTVRQDVTAPGWASRLAAEPPGFDLVVVAYLQLPADGMRVAVDEAVRAARPGGRLFLVGHDRRNLAEGVGGPPVLDVLWDSSVLTGWLSAAADVTEAATLPRPVPGADRDALDTVVRAVRRPAGVPG